MKTIDSRPTKLIEVALPLPEINDASSYDKMPGIGPHPKGIHHWWARLPLPVARAVLFASVVDDPSGHPERFPTPEAQDRERERLFSIIRRLMQKRLHKQSDAYAEARTIVMEVARRFGYFRRDSEFHKLGYDILFRRQIDFGVTSVNYALAQRLARAEEAQ
jgi:adenine-specific DNA methylase